jgi:hypothetical protein
MTDDRAYDEIRASELRDLEADLGRVRSLLPSSHRNRARTTTEQSLDDAIKADQAAARAREPVVDEVPSWLLPLGAAGWACMNEVAGACLRGRPLLRGDPVAVLARRF